MDLQNTGNVARVEIVNTIKDAGIKPSDIKLNQLSEAVIALIKKELENFNIKQGDYLNLKVGKEIKWNATYKGKQVYAQLFEYGRLTVPYGQHVPHNIKDVEWIQINYDFSTIYRDSEDYYYPVVVSKANPAENWYSAVNPEKVFFRTEMDRKDHTATLCLMYTKKSDKVIE